MHQELAKDGLVVISLSVDEPDEKGNVLKFLQDQKATFENFLLADKDRNEKGCEYAVLVSLLEPDNELYNTGIVDVFHR